MSGDRIVRVKRVKNIIENLNDLSKEELIERIIRLEANNKQLRSKIDGKQGKNDKKLKRSFDFSKVKKRHVLFKFYYLGWNYQGFVSQEDTINTIENYIFEALVKCCLIENRETSNYHRCGRTDKGVSAFCQVISIDVRSRVDNPNIGNMEEELSYCSMLNRLLPKNIRFYAWTHCSDPAYSARFDCTSRTYKYIFPKGNLNIKNMEEAAKYLIGTNDYRNFCKMDVANGVTNFIRNMYQVSIDKLVDNDMYEVTICSNGFLWHQIRCIMSVLFLVGQEKETPEVVKELFNIEKHPCKPQYDVANEVPLNLFQAEYNCDQNWYIDQTNLDKVISSLLNLSIFTRIQTEMMDLMVSELDRLKMNKTKSLYDLNVLISGVKSRQYKPLLKRQKCVSLDNRIEHYIRKKKIRIKMSDEPVETESK